MKSLSKKTLIKALSIATLCTSLMTVAFAAPPDFSPGEINISGNASRTVAPNYALLNLGVATADPNISVAKSNNDRVMSALIAKLAGQGISKKDIYTSTLNINPVYDYTNNKRTITTYNITTNVTVRINNLNSIGPVIDSAVSVGANDINSLSFQNDVSQQLNDSLTTEAIKDGRHKAEVIAAALGRTLGPVKNVSLGTSQTSSFDNTPRYGKLYAAELSTSTPVEEGSLIVSKNASITYYLQ